MNGKNGGWDLSDLEKEIDSTVDSLLVEKKSRSTPASHPQETRSPAKEAPITNSPPSPSASQTSPPSAAQTPRPSASQSPPGSPRPVAQEFQAKLEEVEAQLLTLEWDINSKHINNAITHLQELRGLSHVGDDLKKVIILIQKVLHQLILDERKLTPAALKFLQKSWKAVKGMTDERFSFEIDKKTLVQELIAEFQKLRIEEEPQEREEWVEAPQPPQKREAPVEERPLQRSPVEAHIPIAEIDKFMNKIETLARVVNEERKRWEGIQQEIASFKAELQNMVSSEGAQRRESSGEVKTLDERISKGPHHPSDIESPQSAGSPSLLVTLCNVSGVMFGIPTKQIIRSFPIKKWVSEFFIERGKVKLKSREIPLFNIYQVFKLNSSTEENPSVLLLKGREDRPAAVIVDQVISREEIACHPIEGRPYIFGQGVSRNGKVWILNAEQISP